MKSILFLFIIFTSVFSCSAISAQEESSLKFKKIKKIKKKNPELFSYTEDIKKALEQKDWTTFISYCLEDNYQTQKELGIGDQQYIYELLNLKQSNVLMDVDIDYQDLIHSTMGQIKKVSTLKYAFIGRAMLGDSYLLKGEIELENGLRVTFQYELLLLNKSFKLIGAVG